MAEANSTGTQTSVGEKNYPCRLITPEGKILDEAVTFISAPGTRGSFGVLAGHAPMVSTLKHGILKIQKNAEVHFYSIDSGVLEVSYPDHAVLILADQAVKTTEPQITGHQNK